MRRTLADIVLGVDEAWECSPAEYLEVIFYMLHHLDRKHLKKVQKELSLAMEESNV